MLEEHNIRVVGVGLLVGICGKLLLKSKFGSTLAYLLLGVAGASIAASVGQVSHAYKEKSVTGLFVSALGAAALLSIHVSIVKKK